MLEVGKKAPAFTARDHTGAKVSLSSLAGKYVVLYFYPRDATPGCTVEACGFRDEHEALRARGAVVLGVSPDSAESHERFVAKHELPFQLLVDEAHVLAEKYGAWAEKNLYGRKSMGIVRSTVLIGPDGKVLRVWPRVKAQGHAAQVLLALDELRDHG